MLNSNPWSKTSWIGHKPTKTLILCSKSTFSTPFEDQFEKNSNSAPISENSVHRFVISKEFSTEKNLIRSGSAIYILKSTNKLMWELFIHYGDDYWRDDREKSKLRQETFKMLSKTVSGLESEIWSLRSDNVDLRWRVEELEQRFSDLLKKLKTE